VKAGELWQRSEAIIGPERFQELVGDHRGGAPAFRHRLIDQLLALESTKDGVSQVREDSLVVSVPEIESILAFAEEGRRHASPAAWQEIQRGFGAPGEYLHAVGVLQVASLLRVHHPATEFQVSSRKQREPDLILVVTDHQVPLAVEVKALDALWQPTTSIDLGEARRLVRKALADAGTVIGQLRADRPGVLSLVGLNMSGETYRMMARAFEHHLATDGQAIPHVLGLAVANLRTGVETSPGIVSPLLEQASTIRRNPAYRGPLHIDDDWARPWRLVSRQ
jgi:hypothetical protein